MIERSHTLKIMDVGVIGILDVNTREEISNEGVLFELEISLNRALNGLHICDKCLTPKIITRRLGIRRVK